RLSDEAIRVEVTDQGTGRQDLRPRSMQPPSGLGFVHLLTDRWSSTPVESFQVWFEIDITTNGLTKRRTPVDQSSWPSSSKPE
ncbi:MAG: hypothetical protein ACXVFJ_01680, partial [Gaiellaceae bacterium]